jgi:hypothetical protein
MPAYCLKLFDNCGAMMVRTVKEIQVWRPVLAALFSALPRYRPHLTTLERLLDTV